MLIPNNTKRICKLNIQFPKGDAKGKDLKCYVKNSLKGKTNFERMVWKANYDLIVNWVEYYDKHVCEKKTIICWTSALILRALFVYRKGFVNTQKGIHENTTNIKVIMASYQFSSDIVKTLAIYYFMLLEYMCGVLKLLTIQNPIKLSKLKKRLNTKFPMLRENWTTSSITVNKYSLPLQSHFLVRLKGGFTIHLAKFKGNWPSSSEDKKL